MTPFDLSAVIASGFVATFVMTLVSYAVGGDGLSYLDALWSLIELRLGATAGGLSVLVLFFVGIVLAALFAAVWLPLTGLAPLIGGVLFGATLSVPGLTSLVIVDMRAVGKGRRKRLLVSVFVSHLSYGLVMGGYYGLLA